MVPTYSQATAAASIVLLGAPYVEREGEKREFLPERRYELLAHLAYRGTWVNRDALAFMFWPDQDNADARRNLRFVLHSARELPEFRSIEAERARIRLAAQTDVHRFEAAVREAKWAEAIALYRGALCAGFDADGSEPFAQWLRLERGRLAELFHRAAMAQLAESSPAEAVTLARRLLENDPTDEEALNAALRALRDLGEERDARRLHREFSERLMDELGLEPGPQTRALMHEFDVPTAEPVPPPIESTFVGRAQELAEIATLLATPGCRLLTLIGPGGVGKSRLAKQAMTAVEGAPVTIVPLEALTVPAQLAGEVARAVGLRLGPRDDPGARVQAYFAERHHLVLLDNFEHLIDAAGQLERWLSACPGLQAIVTSRERLGIASEWLLPVEGLTVPRPDETDIAQFDAIQLFVDRARAAKRGFDLVAEREAVASIVTQADGMPLAIELAAAWTRLLPCADIARDLAESLELLETESAVRAEQRSVRASFEHSWSLLMTRERALFAKLSVFHGGFDREAARQVADGMLIAIAQLVDKSLVRADGAGRFALHPLLRQFASEKLAGAPEEEVTRQRHAEFFVHWMERFAGARQVDLAAAVPALDAEIGNCLSAWDWSIAHQRADLVRTSSVVLLSYFERRSRLRDGLEYFERAQQLQPATPGFDGAAGNVHRALATLSLRMGRYDNADRHARQSLQHCKVTRDAAGIKSALTTLGLSHWQRARYGEAQRYFMEGLRRCRADGDRGGEAGFLTNLALIAKADGRYAETEELLTKSIGIYRDVGDFIHMISALNNLGNLCRSLKQPARGRAPLLEALALAEQTDDAITLPFVVINLALIELELGNLDVAQRYCERALEIVRNGADRQIETGCHATLARIELARGAPQMARSHLRTSAMMARELKHVPLLLGAAVNEASALRLEGNADDAAAILCMVRSHPSAGQPDRDDAERELVALRPLLSDDALAAALARSTTLSLDDVIARAIGAVPPSGRDPA